MILTLSAALAAAPTAEQGEPLVVMHDIGPRHSKVDYESACGTTVFRVRFRNGPEEHGQVDRVTIDGREVAEAAELLRIRAARRVISRIGIMNCGIDPRRPVFRGVMELSAMESQRLGMRPSLYFKLARDDRRRWRLSIDQEAAGASHRQILERTEPLSRARECILSLFSPHPQPRPGRCHDLAVTELLLGTVSAEPRIRQL